MVKNRERITGNIVGAAVLRVCLLFGVCAGVISAQPSRPESLMSFSDVLHLLEKQENHGGTTNRDASVDYLRYAGSVRVTCRSRGMCNCYSKAVRRSFCCDCMNGPCFPADAQVTTSKGPVSMADLQIGDIVLAGTESGEVIWTPVVAWLDRRPHEEAQYLSIAAEAGKGITLSSSHLLFTADEGHPLHSKFAGETSPKESLVMIANPELFSDEEDKDGSQQIQNPDASGQKTVATNITSISPVIKTGAFVPMTESGTIFINGILASCYASVTHNLAHLALAPLRWFPSKTEEQIEGTRTYVSILKWLAFRVLPSRYLAPKDHSVIVEGMDEMAPHQNWHSILLRTLDHFSNLLQLSVLSV